MRENYFKGRFGVKAGCLLASAALAASVAAAPSSAFALEVADDNPGGWAAGAPVANTYSSLPEKFDLRNVGGVNYVTDVRDQSPWGSCWAFSVMAAAETSMLWDAAHDEMTSNPPSILNRDSMNLSERHLAWFTYTALPDDPDDSQAGEGLASMSPGSARLDTGGMPLHGTSLFSSGIGPVSESSVPYQANDGSLDKDADWSVDEGKRFATTFDIEETNALPSSGAYFASGDMQAGNAAVQAMKEELYQGRALSIGFMADQSKPGDELEKLARAYINPENWAHYTYEQTSINHAVTIVGWDDTYSKDNFGNPDPETGEVDPEHRPPADGAWIVKNSWGEGWGDGGYFYLSYYDKSLGIGGSVESFDFNVADYDENRESYSIAQHDLLPSSSLGFEAFSTPTSMANVFDVEEDALVRTLTCETAKPNTEVTYKAYVIKEGVSTPTDEPVLEVTETYEWGGFHTLHLDALEGEDLSFEVSAGDRVGVEVTQRCIDDAQYYVVYDATFGKESAEEQREQWREENWDTLYETNYKTFEDMFYIFKVQQLIDQGLTSDEAAEQAKAFIESEETKAKIDELVTGYVENMVSPSYYGKAVVNEGESFIMEMSGSTDWKDYTAGAAAQGVQVDNFPIKFYAYEVEESEDPADAESLKWLEDNIKTAMSNLQNTKVSTDGSDVPKGEKWVDQAAYDAYAAAIESAEEALVIEKPSQADIDNAAADLKLATEAFETAKKDGAKDDAQGGGQVDLDELHQQLQDAIDKAVADLEKAQGQASKEAADAFKKAIEEARNALNEGTEEGMKAALGDLKTASDSFAKATGQGSVSPAKPGANADKGGFFAKTGDAGLIAAAMASVGGVIATIAGWFSYRRMHR